MLPVLREHDNEMIIASRRMSIQPHRVTAVSIAVALHHARRVARRHRPPTDIALSHRHRPRTVHGHGAAGASHGDEAPARRQGTKAYPGCEDHCDAAPHEASWGLTNRISA